MCMEMGQKQGHLEVTEDFQDGCGEKSSKQLAKVPTPAPAPLLSLEERSKESAIGQVRVAFDNFWKAYPKKAKKPRAWKAWTKLAPDPDLVLEIMAGLERHKRGRQWQEGYIDH